MAEITYRMENGYRLPNLLPPQESLPLGEDIHLGKYALLRRKFLKQHRRVTYTNLLTSGKLNAHLMEIEQTAQARMEQLTAQIVNFASGGPPARGNKSTLSVNYVHRHGGGVHPVPGIGNRVERVHTVINTSILRAHRSHA